MEDRLGGSFQELAGLRVWRAPAKAQVSRFFIRVFFPGGGGGCKSLARAALRPRGQARSCGRKIRQGGIDSREPWM